MKGKRITKLITVLLAAAMLFGIMTCNKTSNVNALSTSDVQSLINAKMTNYNFKPGGGSPPSSQYRSGTSGCFGFVDLLTREFYGTNLPSQASNHYEFNNYSTNYIVVGTTLAQSKGNLSADSLRSLFLQSQPGDVIQMDYTKTDGTDSLHTMMVYTVTSEGVVFYHAGSSNVYFGASNGKNPLYGTNGSILTWEKFYSYLTSSDDGITVYRSKYIDNASTSNPGGETGNTPTTTPDVSYPTPSVDTRPDIVEETALFSSYPNINVTWRIDRDCTLWIVGSGIVNRWVGDSSKIPWSDYRSIIKKVNVISTDPDQGIMFTSTWCMFYKFSSCKEFNLSGMDTSCVDVFASMFCDCSKVTSLDLSNFDTSSCTDFSNMFEGCTKLTSVNLSSFDTSSAEKTYSMFYGCSSLETLNLSNFDTSSVLDARQMFYGCSSLTSLDLSNFSVSKVQYMQSLFSGCSSLRSLNLSNWDTYTVLGMGSMLNNCRSDLQINFGERTLSAREFVDEYTYLSEPTVVSNSFLVRANTNLGSLINVTPATSTPTSTPTATPTSTVTSTPVSTNTTTPTNTTVPTSTNTPAPTTSETGIAGFAERLYTCALGRSSEPDGKTYWINQLSNGVSGADAARVFLLGSEVTNSGISDSEFIGRLYKTFMNRDGSSAEINYWCNLMITNGLTREIIFQSFVNSPEWIVLCNETGINPGNTNSTPSVNPVEAFATRLYTTCLCRDGEESGVAYWTRELSNGNTTGTSAAYGFFFGPELTSQNISDEDFINRLYRTFMGREADADGLNFWLNNMRNGVNRVSVFYGFAQSNEFISLCNEAGIQP